MKKLLLLYILFIIGCEENAVEANNIVYYNEEALEFSLQFINSIIEQDITTFKACFSDSLYLLDGDSPIELSDVILENIFYSK